MSAQPSSYQPSNRLRFVTATSLFDGHDAAINLMRRILQSSGCEVIHLGHDRAAEEVVDAAIEEDAHGIAVSSYQGGHIEYFKYMRDLLVHKGAPHIQLFGGGGGVIVPEEIEELHAYGIARIYSPEDGRRLGLQGMIDDMMRRADFDPVGVETSADGGLLPIERQGDDWAITGDIDGRQPIVLARVLTLVERMGELPDGLAEVLRGRIATASADASVPVIGFTGTGGSGKSSLVDEIVHRFLRDEPERSVAIVSIDPSKWKGGGALLGDRIRMNAIASPRVYMRSLATRGASGALSDATGDIIGALKATGFDLILVETSGIGQADRGIVDVSDRSVYVMTQEFGAHTQLEKINMIDVADCVVLNKYDRRGSEDALKAVRKQVRRGRLLFDPAITDEDLPVYGTIASRFNDDGVNAFYHALRGLLEEQSGRSWATSIEVPARRVSSDRGAIIPAQRVRYLADIARTCRDYRRHAERQAEVARQRWAMQQALDQVDGDAVPALQARLEHWEQQLDASSRDMLDEWDTLRAAYDEDRYTYQVRGRDIHVALAHESLSGSRIPKVALPRYRDPGEVLRWRLLENLPGHFPYTAGIYPFKRTQEDPKRQFAGEGPPEQTNRRFHFLTAGDDVARLSTAFDSVTLYGNDPAERPDIYGKIGESGVSVCTLDDIKKLYDGFDLCEPTTSVSMTINGPAPMMLAMYFNAAIDQQLAKFERQHGRAPDAAERADVEKQTLQVVRGTVQADILKEDQAQNTCIFSTEFALRMMGDIQEFFIEHGVRNYYSVSISGYHIAEAGANPITQLALTLANGFTYVEYYLARGMDIDAFGPNLSFFFSNGMEPEYSVIGRVARRIWSVAMRDRYGASPRSQMLKYHIQTSGRSLHAQEMDFNDIRTTLQGLLAFYDNCNSLHTNAYDEAVTTPTEEAVRRAMAIQLIIGKEFGLARNENPNQGAFVIDELTDLVEEAVLTEFDRISERGGVLGAMELQYQRSKIQDESLYYEHLKHNGQYPIVGVNTFLNPAADGGSLIRDTALTRCAPEGKQAQIDHLAAFQQRHADDATAALARLQRVCLDGGNVFAEMMRAARVASLGQISHALYEVGGRYRRSM